MVFQYVQAPMQAPTTQQYYAYPAQLQQQPMQQMQPMQAPAALQQVLPRVAVTTPAQATAKLSQVGNVKSMRTEARTTAFQVSISSVWARGRGHGMVRTLRCLGVFCVCFCVCVSIVLLNAWKIVCLCIGHLVMLWFVQCVRRFRTCAHICLT